MGRLSAGLSLALVCAALPAFLLADDLHRDWDQTCGGCHGHAGEFARTSLRLVEGRLVGVRQGERVASFLDKHNGGYPPATIRAMQEMLRAQVATPELFSSMCKKCHGTAARFAREGLSLRDGRLFGRATGEPVEDFLPGHRGLDQEQADFFVDVLGRVRREVGN